MLRARKSRREETLETRLPEPVANRTEGSDPEYEAMLADSVGLAMLVVLERLAPAERLAFVLHDMFALSFDEIGPIVGRSSTAARQLASRARRRVQGVPTVPVVDLTRQREVVNAFFAASRGGDFDALLTLLDPDVVFQADSTAVRFGGPQEVRGATAVAKLFSGRAHGAKPALVNGAPGAVVAPLGQLFLALVPTITDGKIVKMEVIADSERLSQLDIAVLGD
ncbi:MAG: polymerase sigma factor protein [Chthonomonadales bacterium]|nr:polymerase sigma factor protein [Chthonomonadales bacterium]